MNSPSEDAAAGFETLRPKLMRVKAFFTASRSGDMQALGAMLAADVSVHADGGARNRGWQGRGNLCGAQSRQAQASALGPRQIPAPAPQQDRALVAANST